MKATLEVIEAVAVGLYNHLRDTIHSGGLKWEERSSETRNTWRQAAQVALAHLPPEPAPADADLVERLAVLSAASNDLAFANFHTEEMTRWFTNFISELRETFPEIATALTRVAMERDAARFSARLIREQQIEDYRRADKAEVERDAAVEMANVQRIRFEAESASLAAANQRVAELEGILNRLRGARPVGTLDPIWDELSAIAPSPTEQEKS